MTQSFYSSYLPTSMNADMYGLVNELSQQPYCASSQVEAIKWMRWAGRRAQEGHGNG